MTALRQLGVAVFAASVDAAEDAGKLAETLSFPVGFGLTEDDAKTIGAFWDAEGSFMQPTEFILRGAGNVIASTYSSSPVGRIRADDAVSLIKLVSKKAT